MKTIFLSLATGLSLGFAQYYSKIFFSSSPVNVLMIGVKVLALYFLATFTWVLTLKSNVNITFAYGCVILGTFISLMWANFYFNNEIASLYNFIGVMLIIAGVLMLKH